MRWNGEQQIKRYLGTVIENRSSLFYSRKVLLGMKLYATAGQHPLDLFSQYRARGGQWMALWREELDIDAFSILSEMIL